MYFLPQLDEHDRHAGVLTDRQLHRLGGGDVIRQIVHDVARERERFASACVQHRLFNVVGKMAVGVDAEPADRLFNVVDGNIAHRRNQPFVQIWFTGVWKRRAGRR